MQLLILKRHSATIRRNKTVAENGQFGRFLSTCLDLADFYLLTRANQTCIWHKQQYGQLWTLNNTFQNDSLTKDAHFLTQHKNNLGAVLAIEPAFSQFLWQDSWHLKLQRHL
ncbi:hypothetical protein KL943_004591 [Ogataea angusta]|nr:hypothetical protein KL943_004591 [Ogataea angusta]